ncbi:hypothetical protein Cadr_000019345 [Camelus dromedarius]|uniref:Uncharacterized protein n=1 Tax=Camelus dromedarius TaxID=9838 RepID=A0A5N4D138_CAMDR|nr:hypothetical protein Cadr_000019345 [Camelus dromedarius]
MTALQASAHSNTMQLSRQAQPTARSDSHFPERGDL